MADRSVSRTYDPGSFRGAIYDRVDGTWLVYSFTQPDAAYRVNLKVLDCTCPQWRKRLKDQERGCCKHMTAAAQAEQEEFERRLAKSQDALKAVFA